MVGFKLHGYPPVIFAPFYCCWQRQKRVLPGFRFKLYAMFACLPYSTELRLLFNVSRWQGPVGLKALDHVVAVSAGSGLGVRWGVRAKT